MMDIQIEGDARSGMRTLNELSNISEPIPQKESLEVPKTAGRRGDPCLITQLAARFITDSYPEDGLLALNCAPTLQNINELVILAVGEIQECLIAKPGVVHPSVSFGDPSVLVKLFIYIVIRGLHAVIHYLGDRKSVV